MNWYYADNNSQQQGPVSEEEICRLIAQRSINGETRVWNESLPAWQKLSFSTLASHLDLIPKAATPPPLTPSAPIHVPPPMVPATPVNINNGAELKTTRNHDFIKAWIGILIVIGVVVVCFATNIFSGPSLEVSYNEVAAGFCDFKSLSVKNAGDNPVTVKKITVNNTYVLPQDQAVTLKTGEGWGAINTYAGPEPVKVEVETDQGTFTKKVEMGEVHSL